MNNNKNNDDNAIVKPDTSADDAAAEAVARALSLSNSISFYLLFLISNDLHLRRVPPPSSRHCDWSNHWRRHVH